MSKKSFFRSDKELEDLLRKISDSAEIPFSKADWGDMKARLDQLPTPTPTPGWWGKKNVVWVGVVLLSLMLSLVIWNSLPLNQVMDQDTTGFETTNQPSESTAEKSERTAKESIIDTKTPVDTDPLLSEAMVGSAEVHSILSSRKTEGIEKKELTPWTLDSRLPEISALKDPENIPILWQSNQIPSLEFTSFMPSRTIYSAKNMSGNQKKQTKNKSSPFAGRFNLSIQAAPDLSGIKLNQVGKAGQAVGIGAAYFLRPRLSISSGVFYSFKPYSADGETIQSYVNLPDRILGECDILDIPFNFRYYPVEGRHQRAFVSLGLSSYFMLKEHYELEYQNSGTGYSYTKEINVSGVNNHFFGVVNISVGYERKLGKQLGIQVEPYFKVPINGVGEGDISLKSTGLFVGINYYPGRPKKK